MKAKKKINPRKIVGNISKRHIKNGSYSFAATGIVIAAVIVVNMIVGEIPSQYTQLDVSEEKLYTITDDTKDLLKNLEKEVTLYQVVQSGREDDTIEKLLERYEDASSKITVEKKDPVVNPAFVSSYTSDQLTNNSIIVVCGDKNKVVDYNDMYETSIDYNTLSYNTTGFDGEGQLTSAISYVTSDNLPILYVVEGHGETALDSGMEDAFKKDNIDIQSLNLLTEGQVPEDADCIMINSPSSDISTDERDYIIDYLENGGKALIFSDYTDQEMPNFDQVLESYGIKRAEGIVLEGDSQHFIAQTPYYLVPNIVSNDITGDMASSGYYVLAPVAQGIQTMEDIRDTLTIESLLTTSDSAYSKVNVDSGTLEKESEDLDGPFDIGVAVSEDLGDGSQTQMVYFSTSSILLDQMNQTVSGGNSKLILQTLSWMCKDTGSSISIPSKSYQLSYLTITTADSSFWSIVTTAVLPVLFLIIGFVVWLKRRKA